MTWVYIQIKVVNMIPALLVVMVLVISLHKILNLKMNNNLYISFGSNTDTGLDKEFNTDAALEFKILDGNVFIVCDGHNGVEGHGALAAKLVLGSIKKYFYNSSFKDLTKALTNAITFANEALYDQAKKDSKYEGISSTLAMVICRNENLYYAYAGDSRIYVCREDELKPLTRDHVEDPANASGAEVKILLGKTKDIKFEVCKIPLSIAEDDVFLLCTDGLTDQLNEDEIKAIVNDANKAPEHKCKDLIEAAKEKGGSDCVSVQIIEFNKLLEPIKKKRLVNLHPVLYLFLAIIALAVFSFAGYKGFEVLANRPARAIVIEEPLVDNPEIKNKTTQNIIEPIQKEAETVINVAEAVVNIIKEPIKEVVVPALLEVPIYYSHKISYGENLYRLAKRFNLTQKKLTELNGNKAKSLVAGSILKIPVKALHKVESGESLSVISDEYNVKIKTICQATEISKTAVLKVGMMLIIPNVK